MILTNQIPAVGMVKNRDAVTGDAAWFVTISVSGLTPDNARQLAAELLNAADECERLTEAGR